MLLIEFSSLPRYQLLHSLFWILSHFSICNCSLTSWQNMCYRIVISTFAAAIHWDCMNLNWYTVSHSMHIIVVTQFNLFCNQTTIIQIKCIQINFSSICTCTNTVYCYPLRCWAIGNMDISFLIGNRSFWGPLCGPQLNMWISLHKLDTMIWI